MRNNKKLAVLILIIGVLGLASTAYFIINSYFNAKNINTLLKPVVIGFIPFFISFALLRIGIDGLINKK